MRKRKAPKEENRRRRREWRGSCSSFVLFNKFILLLVLQCVPSARRIANTLHCVLDTLTHTHTHSCMLTCTAVYISDFWAWPLLCIDLFDWLAFCTFLISAGLCRSACCDSQKAQGTRQRKLGGACSMWHAACGRVALSCQRIKQNEIFHKRIATRNHKAKWFICKVLRVRPECTCVWVCVPVCVCEQRWRLPVWHLANKRPTIDSIPHDSLQPRQQIFQIF